MPTCSIASRYLASFSASAAAIYPAYSTLQVHIRPSMLRARSTTVKYCCDPASSESATLRIAALTASGVIAGDRSLASGPPSSGEEPNPRELSFAIPARRIASVLGGATGVSVNCDGNCCAAAGVVDAAACGKTVGGVCGEAACCAHAPL